MWLPGNRLIWHWHDHSNRNLLDNLAQHPLDHNPRLPQLGLHNLVRNLLLDRKRTYWGRFWDRGTGLVWDRGTGLVWDRGTGLVSHFLFQKVGHQPRPSVPNQPRPSVPNSPSPVTHQPRPSALQRARSPGSVRASLLEREAIPVAGGGFETQG